MFTTKAWESDVPNGKISFGKKAVKKKNSKLDVAPKSQTEISEPFQNTLKRGFPTKRRKIDKTSNKVKPNIHLNKHLGSVKNVNNNKSKTINKNNNNIEEAGKFVRSSLTNSNDKNTIKSKLKNMAQNSNMKKIIKKDVVKKMAPVKSNTVPNASKKESNFVPRTHEIPRKRKIPQDIGSSQPKPKKNKLKRESHNDSLELSSFGSDKPDEVLINVKKKQLNEAFKNDDREEILFSETKAVHKLSKKEKLKKILSDGLERNQIKTNGNKLRQRMLDKLKAAQFRYLNEKLYTSSGPESQELFRSDPAAFATYHQGYQQQVRKWPVNPLDVIVNKIKKMPKTTVVADMGCGEGHLSRRVSAAVRSFDLVSAAPCVEACDMAHTPLLARSVDVVVYCLALMGTELTQYLVEANRVLKLGGLLLIAEVESRFEDPETFSRDVARLGFKLLRLDKSNQVFYFLEFKKVGDPPVKKTKLPHLTLKPCLYKRR